MTQQVPPQYAHHPNYGRQAPPTYPPPHKRRSWPWVVGGIVALIVIIVVAASGGGGPSSPAPADNAALAADAQAPAEAQQDNRLAVGETVSWDNEAVTVAAPERYTADNPFMRADPGNRLVAVEITFENIGDTPHDVITSEITATFDGNVVEMNMNSEETGELRISVRPDVLASDTAFFSGRV